MAEKNKTEIITITMYILKYKGGFYQLITAGKMKNNLSQGYAPLLVVH